MRKENIKELIKAGRLAISDAEALNNIDFYPAWESVVGIELSQDDIAKGYDRYRYEGRLYRLIQAHTPQADWTPDQTPALWAEISLEEWPLWRQPFGAHDAYQKGDKVTWNEKRWTSAADNNVWEPGAYGWQEVIEETQETEVNENEVLQTDGSEMEQ